MDIVYHAGVKGSSPYVDFYPYTPSASAGWAFVVLFGIVTGVHIVLTIPFRAAYFIPLILGGICEAFGYYGRAWSHHSRTDIRSWALQEMLILCAPPLISATVYMTLGRIIRSLGAESLLSIRPKILTFIFVTNDILCLCTQLGGAGVQVTGDAKIMNIGKHVVLAGLILSLLIFALCVFIAAKLHIRFKKTPPVALIMHADSIKWVRYMWSLYVCCAAIMIRNLVRTIQFGAPQTSAVNTQEAYIYVFDAFMMFFAMLVLIAYHPGRLIKQARRLTKADEFSQLHVTNGETEHVPLTEYEPRPLQK